MRLFLLGSVALLLAGCGGESGSGSPESPPAETRTGPAPDPGLLITRPRARGYDLLLEITTAMEERMGPDLEREAQVVAEATVGQRVVYALLSVDAEVNNGGFEQFFFNSSGALMDEAIEGADRIDAPRHVAILQEAAGVFPDGIVPEDREERWTALDGLSDEQLEKLSALDDRWFALDRELERRMLAYVEANPEEFFR
jgi:Domain of unknown function (DUF4375)